MSTSANERSSLSSPLPSSASASGRARSFSSPSLPAGRVRRSNTMGASRNPSISDPVHDAKKPPVSIGTFRLKLGGNNGASEDRKESETSDGAVAESAMKEIELPSLFVGMWQLSSNAWGPAPLTRVQREIERHIKRGFVAFADHYGSSEVIFGKARSGLSDPSSVFGATKYCVFHDIELTREMVETAVRERLSRMQQEKVDLLQFHWQFYSNKGYLEVLRHLRDMTGEGPGQEDKLIRALGLCNFDAKRTDEICTFLGPGAIVTNQVQFSLIDTRPLQHMVHVCEKHNVKLLTYGTLCGGLLSDRWLGKPEPASYDPALTPSQRKYLDMILRAWGTWDLFQELLKTLRDIADRHNANTDNEPRTDNENEKDNNEESNTAAAAVVEPERASIANIATRWVLDHSFVGAVLVGTRLGISSHMDDNLRVFNPTFFPSLESESVSAEDDSEGAASAADVTTAAHSHRKGRGLTDEDRAAIEMVLERSNGGKLVDMIGDCGDEYRLAQRAEDGDVEMA